jgi:hypothetical protein
VRTPVSILPIEYRAQNWVPTSCTVSAQDALTPTQPQLRLEHEQLSSLNGKENFLSAHWDIVLRDMKIKIRITGSCDEKV